MRFSVHLKKASLVGAFFVSVVFCASAHALCVSPGPLKLVNVAQVIDGDTLRLADGRSVRLIGVNTPELGRNGRSAEPFAEKARRQLEALVRASDGRVGLYAGQEPLDRYGRVLAHAFDAQGANLEATLLSKGLGYFVAISPNIALVACHRQSEMQARQSAAGLWQKPRITATHALRRGGFALVSGQVEGVERNRGGVWVELDGSAVVHIPLDVLDHFDARALAALPGQKIEARGWVIDRRHRAKRAGQARWMLQITHPAMLEGLR